MEKILELLCKKAYSFLHESVSIMPKPFCKFFAYYYPDARIRKLYYTRLNVFMGDNTFANPGLICVTNEETPVQIGKNVSIGPNCVFVACAGANNGNAINQIPYVADKLTVKKPVFIEDEVWLGANVTVLPGVTIGTCSVIGAGSVVTKDVEPYSIYAGVPAKKIRDLRNLNDDQQRTL